MLRKAALFLFCLSCSLPGGARGSAQAGTPAVVERFPVDAKLGGIDSPYTETLRSLAAGWSDDTLAEIRKSPAPFVLHCYAVPQDPFYVGVLQVLRIDAPLERVAAVVDDFQRYPRIFEDLLKVDVARRDGNRSLTHWEQSIGIPFIPNDTRTMIYLRNAPTPDRRVYRYQLERGNHLGSNDGLIVLERLEGTRTRYFELDFIDAAPGLARIAGSSRFWRDTVREIYQADVAILLRSEHVDWADERVLEESKRQSETAPVDELIRHRSETPAAF